MKIEEVNEEAAARAKAHKGTYRRFMLTPHEQDRKTVIITSAFYLWQCEHKEPKFTDAVKAYTGINLDTHRIAEHDLRTLRLIHDRFWFHEVRKRKENEVVKCTAEE